MGVTTKTIGDEVGDDYPEIQDFIDTVPDNAAVGDPWVGTLTTAKRYLAYVWDIDNVNEAAHGLMVDPSVRYDGTGQRNGAYVEGDPTENTAWYKDAGPIFLDDMLIINAGGGGKSALHHSTNQGGMTLLRCTVINEGDFVNEWVMRFNFAQTNLDLFLCQFFGGIRFSTAFDLGGVSGGRAYCNTWGQFDLVAANSGTKFLDSQWDVRGNLAIYKTNPSGNKSFYNPAFPGAGSTKNASNDASNYGTAPIALTADLGLDYRTLISRVKGATINLLRTEADRALGGQNLGQDLSAIIGNRDITYTEFDSTNPIFGAHQPTSIPPPSASSGISYFYRGMRPQHSKRYNRSPGRTRGVKIH